MINTIARRTAVALALVAFAAVSAQAQASMFTTQLVTYNVQAINQIAFAGTPTLTISTAVAGSAPASATAGATWAVTTNQTTAKITASTPAMPAGLTLSSNLAAPAGATSLGLKALSAVAVDLVTGVTKVAQGAMAVTYQLDATVLANVVAGGTTLVTYTITGGT